MYQLFLGDRLREGSAINTSLLMLGTVIEKLAAGDSRTVIPYRDSALTKLLKSALGGNSKTVMVSRILFCLAMFDNEQARLT